MLDIEQPDQIVQIGQGLIAEIKEALISLSQKFKIIFTWTADDVLRIPHELIIQ